MPKSHFRHVDIMTITTYNFSKSVMYLVDWLEAITKMVEKATLSVAKW